MQTAHENFGQFQNLTIEHYTSFCPVTANEDTNLHDLEKLMEENNIRHIPVIKNKKAIGIISQRDLLTIKFLKEKVLLSASDIMNKEIYTVNINDLIVDVAFEMSNQKIGSAIVNNQAGQIIGIFTVTDALNALIEVIRGEVIN
jgi:acetoin utilization protein AcuB